MISLAKMTTFQVHRSNLPKPARQLADRLMREQIICRDVREGAGWRFIDDIKVTQTQTQTVTSLALVGDLRWMDWS